VSDPISIEDFLKTTKLFGALSAAGRRALAAHGRVRDFDRGEVIFHEAMSRSPGFLQEALCHFCDRLRESEMRACLIQEPVEKRIAQTLLSLQKRFGPTVPITRQEIADLVGTAVETAIRTISQFQKSGWVRTGRGRIEVLDAEALSRLL